MEQERKHKLDWQRTWPNDSKQDFIAKADGQTVGRIYSTDRPGTSIKEWLWFAQGRYNGRVGTGSGVAATKDEAAEAIERKWFDLVARADGDLGPA